MTNIRFDYAERRAYYRLMNGRQSPKSQPDYIELVNTYLKQTKHVDGLTDVSVWDTTNGDKVFLTYEYARNDSYKKLIHMEAIEKIMKNDYSLVDFQELEGNRVRLEMSNYIELQIEEELEQ